MKDIIDLKLGENRKVNCLDKGYVELIDCMPRLIEDAEETADYAIAEAARCSYQRGTKTINDDKSLIRYLIRHKHTSPLEMIEFKFKMKLPIFVARQIIRHRTVSLNEMSGRYSEMPEEYLIPDEIRVQSTTNKQGSEESEEDFSIFKGLMQAEGKNDFKFYNRLLKSGVAREQARMYLPLATYTEWYWKIDLHNLLHFFDLRCDSHAQKETRVFADAMLDLVKPIIPYTIEAWEEYSPYRGGMLLTKKEVEKIKSVVEKLGFNPAYGGPSAPTRSLEEASKTESREWIEKAEQLGFTHEFLTEDEK